MPAIRLPAWLNAASVSYSAENDRLTATADLAPGGAALSARTGVMPATGGELAVTANGTPNMSVNVAPGQAAIQGTITTTQGAYVCTTDSIVNLTIAAANATNPRIDIVVITVEDAQYSGAANDALLQVITGTPAASPSPPAAPANSIILAQVAVAANASSIVSGNITDKRTWTVSRGGVLPCLSTARPSNPYPGMSIFETDTKKAAHYDGTAWTYISPFAVDRIAITSFSNSWGSASAPYNAIALQDADGCVRLEGLAKAGTTSGGTTVLTLPASIPRPPATRSCVCTISGSNVNSTTGNAGGAAQFIWVGVQTDGTLTVRGAWPGAAGDWLVLDGISYMP